MQTIEAVPTVSQGVEGPLDELICRCGFEAALHAETFEQDYEAVIPYLQAHYPTIYNDENFRRGYALGQDFAETLEER